MSGTRLDLERTAALEDAREMHALFEPPSLERSIPAAQWRIFRSVLDAARTSGVRCALGGGLAVSLYTGFWRRPHDLDLVVLPEDREAMIAAMTRAGLADYYAHERYDRKWIYRGTADGVIVDAIWALANDVGNVDARWVEHGPLAALDGVRFRLVPPEELVLSKIYVVQGERSDWPDLLNILFAAAPRLDWQRLLALHREDATLLASLLTMFAWLAPGRARAVPAWVWERLALPRPSATAPLVHEDRVARLDTRPWFSTAAVDGCSRQA